MDRLEQIRELRDAYELALDDAERLRDEYHREIVKLHRSGMSLREIAEGLGISHQRVHQIVSPLKEKPRSRRTQRATAGGAVAALVLITGGALLVSRGTPEPVPSASAPVDEPTSGFCVVVDDPSDSTFAPLTLTARCGREALRRGAIVALDPQSGRVMAVSGVTSRRTLQQALSTIAVCGHGTGDDVLVAYGPGKSSCSTLAGQHSDPRPGD